MTIDARVTSAEGGAIAAPPTRVAGAYEYYLQGLAYQRRPGFLLENFRSAQQLYERAVALEPGRRIALATLPDYIQAGRPATPLSAGVGAVAAAASVGAAGPASAAAPVSSAVALDEGFSLEQYLQDVERQRIERALRQANGVQTRAAELLGLSFRQFRYLVKKYGLKSEGR